jgi:hypothetical protein
MTSLAQSLSEPWAGRLQAALEEAYAALRDGDAAAAERAGKAVCALVRALREVETLAQIERGRQPEEDEEELRADLERRIARFIEADRAEDLLAELEQE